MGSTIKRGFVESIVAVANGLKADLIAVTGDLVDGSVQQLSVHTAPLAGLAARHGVYFVTGNHEYYSGERAWTAEIRRLGLRVLKNEHVVLNHDGASLVLAGVTDLSAHHFSADEQSDPVAGRCAVPPADAGGAGRSCWHTNPILRRRARARAASTYRSRDTPTAASFGRGTGWWDFFQPFTGGLYRLKDLWVYVNRGTGYWGPPNRFGVPSEITRAIRLIAAAQ